MEKNVIFSSMFNTEKKKKTTTFFHRKKSLKVIALVAIDS